MREMAYIHIRGWYVIDEGGFFMKTLTQIVGMEKKYKEGILVKEKTTSV